MKICRFISVGLLFAAAMALSACQNMQSNRGLIKLDQPTEQFHIKDLALYQSAVMPAIGVQELNTTEAVGYQQLLSKVLSDNMQNHVHLIKADTFNRKLGKQPQDVSRFLASNEILPETARQQINLNYPQLRYLFLLQIQQEQVMHKAKQLKNPSMAVIKGKHDLFISTMTIHNVAAKLVVYDLQQQKFVWERTDSIAKTTVHDDHMLVDDGHQLSDTEYHYPKPIPTRTILHEMFIKMLGIQAKDTPMPINPQTTQKAHDTK